MRWSTKSFLYLTLAAALTMTSAFAQRGGGGIGPFTGQAKGLSSTALGAGASFGVARPSSTAIGAGSSIGVGSRGLGNRGTSRAGYGYAGRGDYRNVPYPYFYSPFYYPFLDYGSAPYGGGPGDMSYDPSADTGLVTQNLLGEQVQRLTAELDQMRYAQYAQQQGPPMQGAAVAQPVEAPPPAVTIVLRNGQKLQVQNYAVMDNTFWDFSKQPALKIPISNIDISASNQATAANGGELPQLEAK